MMNLFCKDDPFYERFYRLVEDINDSLQMGSNKLINKKIQTEFDNLYSEFEKQQVTEFVTGQTLHENKKRLLKTFLTFFFENKNVVVPSCIDCDEKITKELFDEMRPLLFENLEHGIRQTGKLILMQLFKLNPLTNEEKEAELDKLCKGEEQIRWNVRLKLKSVFSAELHHQLLDEELQKIVNDLFDNGFQKVVMRSGGYWSPYIYHQGNMVLFLETKCRKKEDLPKVELIGFVGCGHMGNLILCKHDFDVEQLIRNIDDVL